MASDDMLQQVARGIYDPVRYSSEVPQPPLEQLPVDAQMFVRLQARTALKRLRIPSEAMIEAGLASLQKTLTPSEVEFCDKLTVEWLWTAMIDSILPKANEDMQ